MSIETRSLAEEPVRERERKPKPQIISVSEGMLFVSGGEYSSKVRVDEIGNIRYRPNQNIFEYDFAEGVLAINPREAVKIFSEDGSVAKREKQFYCGGNDLVKLKKGLGFVSVKDFFTKKEIEKAVEDFITKEKNLSPIIRKEIEERSRSISGKGVAKIPEQVFEIMLHQLMENIDLKIGQINYLARTIGLKRNEVVSLEASQGKIWEKNKNYSPEELLRQLAENLVVDAENDLPPEKFTALNLSNLTKKLDKAGFFERDKKSIVNFFYLYAEISGQDITDTRKIYEVLLKFPYFEILLDEYKRSADSRFGSTLLLACEKLQGEWDKDASQEN